MAIRQQLGALRDEALVTYSDQHGRVGRPARIWQLTRKADAHFADRHAELSADLLRAADEAFGQEGLRRLTEQWLRRRLAACRARMPPPGAELRVRVAGLAHILKNQGFMAEWHAPRAGGYTLLQNHCAILEAARACPGLCESELALMRTLLGDGAASERTEHTLSGQRRCAYRITGT